MKYLLDTNIISTALARRPDPALVTWIDEHEPDCGLSAVTWGELARGVERLPEGRRRNAAARRLKMLWEDFAGRILPLDDQVAAHWARYHTRATKAGSLPPLHDSWIGATAEFFNLTVVTQNPADFPLLKTETL